MNRTSKLHQRGFTLFEIILAAAIIGVLSMILAPSVKTFLAIKENTYRSTQQDINQRIANAMLDWSDRLAFDDSNNVTTGTLPPSCTHSGSKVFYSVLNEALNCNASLSAYLSQYGVPPSQAKTDTTATQNLRVFQKVSDSALYQEVGFPYPSGPTVTLRYEFGVIYSTTCGKNDSCNTSTELVPSANVLTAVDDTSDPFGARKMPDSAWTPKTTDHAVVYVSTLPLQKRLLASTATQVETIRAALRAYVAAKQAAAPTSTLNFFPRDSDAACASGTPPASCNGGAFLATAASTNMGCWDGWYSLADPNSDILKQVGVGDPTLGRTAWGGTIEYCRDYDPSYAGNGVAPHFGAFRINKDITTGNLPSSGSDSSSYVVVTF